MTFEIKKFGEGFWEEKEELPPKKVSKIPLCPKTLFGADKTKPCVQQVYGVSGSGKTVLLNAAATHAVRSKDFSDTWRLVVFDIKHQGYEDLVKNTVSDMEGFLKSLNRNRITVIHPDIEEADEFLDSVINHLFELAQMSDDFSSTLILEESSTFIGSGAWSIPSTIKRFATQGRSLGLSLLLVNQRALSNKWTDTQSTGIVMFRMANPDNELLKKRWGLNPQEIETRLMEKKFSFAYYDLENLSLDFYNPIKLRKTPSESKKGSSGTSGAKDQTT